MIPVIGDASEHIAKDILTQFGGLKGIMSANPKALGFALSAYPQASSAIIALQHCLEAFGRERISLSRPANLAHISDFAQIRLHRQHCELVYGFFFDLKGALIWDGELASGNRHSVALPSIAIVRRALELSASLVIIAHNHPSGDCTPSNADNAATRNLIRALRAIDVDLYDHLIVAGADVTSMRELGFL